jgi:5-methyltetrahydrofolate--homocysteine methyltransferase
MFGESPTECVQAMEEAGADVVGTNCGNGIENMVRIVKEMKPVATKPILVHSNAGIPKLVATKVVYDETPDVMAGKIKALVEAGAQIVGGCCGTTPEHIKRFREELDKLKR